jgi:HD-like signal output (HDOD) protein
LFPPEFQLLNKFAQTHPGKSVAELEQRLLGMGQARDMLAMGHARIGAWLMEAWRMPEAVRLTLLEHHNPDYAGDYAELVHLVQLSDFLLLHECELPEPADFPPPTLHTLRLLPEQALEIFTHTMSTREQLTALSRQLVEAS